MGCVAVVVAVTLAGCSAAADAPGSSADEKPAQTVGTRSVEQVLGCGPKGLAQRYYENALSRDDWTTAEKAAAGLGSGLLGAESPRVAPWESVSTLPTFAPAADATTWLVYEGSQRQPLGVVQVVGTEAGGGNYFSGNVVARCFQ